MIITLTYNKITVTFKAEGLDASLDIIMLASAILAESRKLHYGNPQVEMDTRDLKIAPTPKP